MNGCWNKEDRVGGKIGAGRTGVREEIEVVAVEEGEEVVIKGIEIGEGKRGDRFVAEGEEEVSVQEEERKKVAIDETVNELQHTEKLGISRDILAKFQQKTYSFYRCFLDRLYAVADLLTDRPEPKPPDSDNTTYRPIVVVLVSLGLITSPGKPTWTKKWTFDHFIKRRRRKMDNFKA